MVKQHIFDHKEISENFRCQILCFLRIVWPEGFVGKNRLRSWITDPKLHSMHFVLEEKGILISHLEVVRKNLKFKNTTYKTYGLTGVLTYPAFRKQGYSSQLINSAKKYIKDRGDGDIIIFYSRLVGFYEKSGFLPMRKLVTLKGNPKHPDKSDETAFMLFLSDMAKAHQTDFDSGELYFGDDTW